MLDDEVRGVDVRLLLLGIMLGGEITWQLQ